MEHTWKINNEEYFMLNNKEYFNEQSKEFAIFLLDIDDTHTKILTQNKSKIKINIIEESLLNFFIISINENKYAFEIYENINKIKKMIESKSLEIGIGFKKNGVLLEDLCFTIDY